MKRHSHTQTQRHISRLFDGELDGQKTLQLWETLSQCTSCATLYARYHSLESILSQQDDAATRLSIERTAKTVIYTVRKQKATATHPILKRFAVVLLPLIAATAALWLLMPASPNSHRISRTEIKYEGARELAPRAAASFGPSHAGIRIFIIPSEGEDVSEPSTLVINDIISFTYTQTQTRGGYLMILGLQKNETTPLWYYPDYGKDRSIPIRGETVDTPLGDGIRLAINHHKGPLRIVALFSDMPVSTTVVESAASKLRQQGNLLDINEPLPLKAFGVTATEYSVVLNIEDINENDK